MGFAVRVRSAGQKYGPTCHQRDRADVTEFVTLVRLSSLGRIRTVFSLVACGGTTASLLSMTEIECNQVSSVALIAGAYFFISIGNSGAAMNHLDIAPTYAGEIIQELFTCLFLMLNCYSSCFTAVEIWQGLRPPLNFTQLRFWFQAYLRG